MNYVFCIETQKRGIKKEREYTSVYRNIKIFYWYELEIAVLPLTAINKKEITFF